MELRSLMERAGRQQQRSRWDRPWEAQKGRQRRPHRRLTRRLLCLPLAGLITLLLVGCVARQPSSGAKRFRQGGSPTMHNVNRGRIGSHRTRKEHND